MIKRFVFAPKTQTHSSSELETRWLEALAHRRALAPSSVRPLRSVLCAALQLESDAPHDCVSIDWFADLDAFRRYEGWELGAVAASQTIEVIAHEVILRGADWLAQRWQTRAPKWKHMALARRAPRLTAAEFSERWRNRPGQIGGGQTPALAIPDAAKGHAYCQNHPLTTSSDPAYDAINEVYFDELADMRSRLDFFRDHPVAQLDVDLVSAPRFMIVREQLV